MKKKSLCIDLLIHSNFSVVLRKHQWVKFIPRKSAERIPVTEDYVANWKEERAQMPNFALPC